MSERAIAMMRLPDGAVRQTCVGCSEILEKKGMLTVTAELNGVVLFEIKPPFTLEDCRAVIQGRHVGRPYGE